MALPRLTAAVALLALAAGLLVAMPPAPALAAPTLTIVDAEEFESQGEISRSMEFTVKVDDDGRTHTIHVDYFTVDGTARDGIHYGGASGRISFLPEDPSEQAISVTLFDTEGPSRDTHFTMNLSSAEGATIARGSATGTIWNAYGPEIGFASTTRTVTEPGDGETTTMTFTVEAAGGSAGTNREWGDDAVEVRYETVALDPDDEDLVLDEDEVVAEPGVDYDHTEGVLVIQPPVGEETTSSVTFEVTVHGNDVYEGGHSKLFDVRLSAPAFGVFLNGNGLTRDDPPVARGEIVDGDAPPTVSIADAEAVAGTKTHVPIRLSHPSIFPVELTWSTSEDSGDTAARHPDDYTAVPSAPVTIPARKTSVNVQVDTKTNDEPQPNKHFFVNLALAAEQDADDAELGEAQATVTILNDKGPVFKVSDVSDLEGNAGGTKQFVFEVTLLPAVPDHTVVVGYETKPGDREIGNATAGQDYVHVEGELTFAPGETNKTVSVTVLGNDFPGFHEVFYLDIFDAVIPEGPTDTPPLPTIQKRRGIGEILNDDGPELRVSDATVVRNKAGTLKLNFPVTLSAPIGDWGCDDQFHAKWGCDILVDYETRDGTAKAGEHYTKAKGTLRIPRDETQATITVDVKGGTDPAPTRQFELRLDWAQLALTVDRRVTGTILNGNGPTISIADLTVKRSETETVDAVFKLGLSQASTDVVRVDFATVDGTSKAGEDYIGRTGTVQFAPGETTAQVVVKVLAGRRSGAFTLQLSNAAYGVLGSKTSAVATVDGLDPPPGSGDPDGDVLRSWGQDRIETAVMASRDHWDAASDAVVATARRFPDALAAGALAAKLDAPLLLTEEGALPAIVAEELDRLGVTRVWLMGGTAAVSAAVEDALVAAGYDVTRIAGEDRFETAALVADEVGASAAGEAMVALGIHAEEHRAWPDALSAGALSAGPDRLPTLLTRGGELPEVTEAALDRLDVSRVYLLGGTAAIAQAVEDRLAELGYEVVRLAGEDRYGTSVAVAAEALRRHDAAKLPVVFATGQNYPDGLAAGALAARLGGLVLLVPPDDLERAPGTRDFLHDNQGRLSGGVVVGGPDALAEAVLTQLRTALGL